MSKFMSVVVIALGVCVVMAGCAQNAAKPAGALGSVRLRDAAVVRREKSMVLVEDARRLWDATKFAEARDLLRQAVIVDPQNEEAALMLRIVSDKIVARDYAAIQHRTGMEVMRGDVDSAEHLVPYADLMVYPENWAEVARKR